MATIKGNGRIFDPIEGYYVANVRGSLETFTSRVIELAKEQGFEVIDYVAPKKEINANQEKRR